MTKDEMIAFINEAYWKGFEDAGHMIIDIATSKSKREELKPTEQKGGE